MTQCINLSCREDAFEDPNIPERKSYFCLRHAFAAIRGHLLFTPLQWEVFNNEGFVDCLVPPECGHGIKADDINEAKLCFPTEWALKHMERSGADYSGHTFIRAGMQNTCMRCNRTIVSGKRYCGACRIAQGLPEDEAQEPLVRCEHWRAEPGPGHAYLRNCERDIVGSRIMLFHGLRWCPGCVGYVNGISKRERLAHGYHF